MKNRNRRTPLSLGDGARWSAYAAAGVAGSLGMSQTAEAAITHVTVGVTLNGSVSSTAASLVSHTESFDGATFTGSHSGFFSGTTDFGAAYFGGSAASGFSVVGFTTATNSFPYASNLAMGANVSTQAFGVNPGTMAFLAGYGNDQFLSAGEGFLGFTFDSGAGSQYGWVRVMMTGAPHNAYTIVDYAYGDVGDAIEVGEVPEPGSLGLLALGAVGLMSWRKRRGSAA